MPVSWSLALKTSSFLRGRQQNAWFQVTFAIDKDFIKIQVIEGQYYVGPINNNWDEKESLGTHSYFQFP